MTNSKKYRGDIRNVKAEKITIDFGENCLKNKSVRAIIDCIQTMAGNANLHLVLNKVILKFKTKGIGCNW